MKHRKAVMAIRSVVAAIIAALGIGALASGRLVVGLLLIGLAACNVALTVAMRRRRADIMRRFPNLATRTQGPSPH
ncbi:MAG: hypothetical protein ACXVKA_13240 [Acidimicrobiia bacterium]